MNEPIILALRGRTDRLSKGTNTQADTESETSTTWGGIANSDG